MKTSLSVEGKTLDHFLVSEAVEVGQDLLEWLAGTSLFPKFYLRRGEKELAAAGSLMSLPFAPRFNDGNTSSMRFFGGQAFFPKWPAKDRVWDTFPRRVFFAPQYEMVREGKKVVRYAHSLEGKPLLPPLQPFEMSPLSAALSHPTHIPTEDKWHELTSALLGEIEEEALLKVVMARRSAFTGHVGSPFALAQALQRAQPGACTFLVQFEPGVAFVGASPERLFWREGGRIYSEAIAGTRQRGKDAAADQKLEMELMESPKEQKEFAIARRSIEEALDPFVTTFDWLGEVDVIKTSTVQHLHSHLEGTLRKDASDQQLIDALHPTAAMGGAPRERALHYLREHEPFERGWYASPIGFTSEKWAEFAVGIRSALVKEKGLYLFAGAGIVSGSDPLKEWTELEQKTQTVRRVLE